MRGHRGASRSALAVTVGLLAFLPLLAGQGCPGGSVVIPIDGSLPGDATSSTNGNVAPTFRFTAPLGTVTADIGDTVLVTWADSDPDNDARISILLDPDSTPNNGNEIPVATDISENDPTNSLQINTGNYGLTTASYRLIARVTDGVNPELVVAATGSLNLYEPGGSSGNISPTIVVTAPTSMLSATEGTSVPITYCGHDVDGGDGGVVADVLILLDTDNNPLNDVFAGKDLNSADAAEFLVDLCTGTLPAVVNGAVVVGCAKDDKCTNPAAGTNFNLTVNATKIPQTPDGEPYRIRVTMWDHTNPPTHAYAPGMLSLSLLANGTVDLGKVGKRVTGTKFIGFDTGALAGYTGTTVHDFDDDGADDFIVVARKGRPYERGNVGSAYLVYGLKGQRYGGEVFLNSYGTEYRGMQFASGRTRVGSYILDGGDPVALAASQSSTPITEGICAVSAIEDLSGDGKPEILFGLPYVELMYDYYDDDPCDDDTICYADGLPNTASNGNDNDDIGAYDVREAQLTDANGNPYLCSNDGDLATVSPINQGYVVYVNSENAMENTVLDIALAGQKDPGSLILEEDTIVPGSSAPVGARLRGAYYTGTFSDQTQSFGATLGSMPDLGNGGTSPVKDGRPEFLFSMPGAATDRGAVLLVWGSDLPSFVKQEVKSIPDILQFGDCTRTQMVPDDRVIWGSASGDEFGNANRAGDFNRDGHQDILCGAPGHDWGAVSDAGAVYVIYGRLDFGDGLVMGSSYVPRLEIHGTVTGDRFGSTQTALGDVNNDGFGDIAFASKLADGPGGVDSGCIGIVFGGRPLTGEQSFSVTDVGTAKLPGVVFYGTQVGGNAGAVIADAGDFNHDGFDDLLISAPKETYTLGGITRRGVAYLIFGGPHLVNGFHLLNEVGAPTLPGIVFVSPYGVDTADEATIDYVGAAGDVDGDGFADVMLGISTADFVNPLDPSQRRTDAGEMYLIYGNNSGGNVVGSN